MKEIQDWNYVVTVLVDGRRTVHVPDSWDILRIASRYGTIKSKEVYLDEKSHEWDHRHYQNAGYEISMEQSGKIPPKIIQRGLEILGKKKFFSEGLLALVTEDITCLPIFDRTSDVGKKILLIGDTLYGIPQELRGRAD